MLVTLILSLGSVNVYAAAPAGVDTSKMDGLIDIVFWIARIAIAAVGGVPALIKIVQGQADENPRDRNSGIATLIITGVVIGATFAVRAVLFS